MTLPLKFTTSYSANFKQADDRLPQTSVDKDHLTTSTISCHASTMSWRETNMLNHSSRTEATRTITMSEVAVFTSWEGGSVTVFPLTIVYNLTLDFRTHDSYMLTFTPLTSQSPFPFLVRVLTQQTLSMMCPFASMLTSLYLYSRICPVYKRSTSRTRTPSEFSSVPILVADELARSLTCAPQS